VFGTFAHSKNRCALFFTDRKTHAEQLRQLRPHEGCGRGSNYNCARYLARALDSIATQTYRNFQILVIDDGSTDNTEEIVRHFSSQCVFEKQAHDGPAAARNRGIRISSSPYVAFLMRTMYGSRKSWSDKSNCWNAALKLAFGLRAWRRERPG
jgi:hypothetical protein